MVAFCIKNNEIVAVAVRRGANRRVIVKCSDLKLKKRLHQLYNSTRRALAYDYNDSGCAASMKELAPGTEEHFATLTHDLIRRSDYAFELLG